MESVHTFAHALMTFLGHNISKVAKERTLRRAVRRAAVPQVPDVDFTGPTVIVANKMMFTMDVSFRVKNSHIYLLKLGGDRA